MLLPMMKKPFFIFFLSGTLLLLGGCYGVPVEPVAYGETLPVPPDAEPSPIGIKAIVLAIPRGDTIGSSSPRGLGILCRGPYGMITRSAIAAHLEKQQMQDAFYDTMKSQGYDVTGSPSILFDADEDSARTLYWVGARITDIKMDVCQRTTLLFAYDLGYTGEGSMEVEWTVYDRLRRETAYKTRTRGYSRMDLPNYEAIGLMLDDAFAAAAHNLGADEKFHHLVVRGVKPPRQAEDGNAAVFGPVTRFDPREAVTVVQQPLHKDALTPERLDTLRRVAVQVASGSGHGSGFFISEEGHILTNSHVVGKADRVRIVTADKEYKLTGEVLRRDPGRDVALVKIEEMPAGMVPMLLPLRPALPGVGEDIYVIGSPAREKLQDTVTRGIVSALREPTRADPYPYIQGDAFVYGGNSGGPVLDGRGNIIGLCVAGYNGSAGEALDLNLFIPIGDALRKLDIAHW